MQTQLLPKILALWLAVSATGCGVMPLALDRIRLPSTRMALTKMQEAQGRLAAAQAVYNSQRTAAPVQRPVSAHGATQEAYRRWVEDGVRALPEVEGIVLTEE